MPRYVVDFFFFSFFAYGYAHINTFIWFCQFIWVWSDTLEHVKSNSQDYVCNMSRLNSELGYDAYFYPEILLTNKLAWCFNINIFEMAWSFDFIFVELVRIKIRNYWLSFGYWLNLGFFVGVFDSLWFFLILLHFLYLIRNNCQELTVVTILLSETRNLGCRRVANVFLKEKLFAYRF